MCLSWFALFPIVRRALRRPVKALASDIALVKLMLYVGRVMTLGRVTSCVIGGARGCLVVAERAAPVAYRTSALSWTCMSSFPLFPI